MHIQGVDSEVIGVQVEGGEQLLHGHFLALGNVHHAVSIHAVRPLDETEQMLLVHAGRRMDVSVYLQMP